MIGGQASAGESIRGELDRRSVIKAIEVGREPDRGAATHKKLLFYLLLRPEMRTCTIQKSYFVLKPPRLVMASFQSFS
jgi:hypothetical protein